MSPSIRRSFHVSVVLFPLAGCTESPVEPVAYPAVAVFDAPGPVTVGSYSLALTRAEIAFGPVYFCASVSGSSTLCEAAISEVASSVRLPGLATAPVALGRVQGFTGEIRSASYDYGITWLDTENEPTPTDAAPGGHSMHFEGLATRAGTSHAFTADVDVLPQYQGQTALPTAEARGAVPSSATRLEVHFDVGKWFEQLDRADATGAPYLDSLFAGSPPVASIEPGSFGERALLVGIKNLALPRFEWISTEAP